MFAIALSRKIYRLEDEKKWRLPSFFGSLVGLSLKNLCFNFNWNVSDFSFQSLARVSVFPHNNEIHEIVP